MSNPMKDLASSPEWAAMWNSKRLSDLRARLERNLRSPEVVDPFAIGFLRGQLHILEWLREYPGIEARNEKYRGEDASEMTPASLSSIPRLP